MVVNTTRSSLRTVAAISAAAALTVAACGGDDDDTAGNSPPTAASTQPSDEPAPDSTGGTAEPGGNAPAMQPAAISIDPQDGDGTTITVASVDLPAPGFVAVHGDAGGSPGPVIGTSDLLAAGTSTDVVISLAEPLTTDTTVFPMVHIDTDGNGVYEFGTVDGVDGPGVTADGDVAVEPATITVGGSDDTASEGGAADTDAGVPGEATITIADFSFSGVTEVPVGTTVVVTNDDGASHTWTAVGGAFDSGRLGPGDSFEYTFTEPGEFAYFCNFHPSMTGSIVVTG